MKSEICIDSSQQQENRCPNTNLFLSTTSHSHQYNSCISQNNRYTEYVHSLPVETDKQLTVWGPSNNAQNEEKYLFEKVFSIPTYDCKKQN